MHRLWLAFLTLTFVLLAHPASSADRPCRTDCWVYRNLDLTVSIDPEAEQLRVEGAGVIRWEGAPTREIELNTGSKDLQFISFEASAPAKAQLEWRESRHVAMLALPNAIEAGQEIEIRFATEPVPDSTTFFAGPITVAPWADGWYPAPMPEDQSLGLDLRAPGKTVFHLPHGWRSVSNGVLQERDTTDTRTREVWVVEDPVERSFAAGPFRAVEHELDGRTVQVFLLSPLPDNGKSQAASLIQALTVMEERFGPFPYPTPSIVEMPDGYGWAHAMAVHGFILAETSAFLYSGSNLPLFAHEVAHGWWGNLVRVRGSGWLVCSESLAHYSAILAIESVHDERAATRVLVFSTAGTHVNRCARGYYGLMLQEGFDEPLAELTGDTNIDWELAYSKGPSVLHMLRRQVGDNVFFETLNEVILEYSNEPLTLDALRARFIDNADSDAELGTFFSQWFDRKGGPVLETSWISQGDSVVVTVQQIQTGEPFRFPLDLGFVTDLGSETHRIQLDGAVTTSVLRLEGVPDKLILDPKRNMLIYRPEYYNRAPVNQK